MLNASYNLPSEDCNTTKQMVFHSNKLLCVYSLQPWLSDTFTFSPKLTCFCKMVTHTAFPGKGPAQGGCNQTLEVPPRLRLRSEVEAECVFVSLFLNTTCICPVGSIRSHILFKVMVAGMRQGSMIPPTLRLHLFRTGREHRVILIHFACELWQAACEPWSQVTGEATFLGSFLPQFLGP